MEDEKETAKGVERVAILDYGSQYTQLIARRIREKQVFSEIVRFDTPAKKLLEKRPKGIILSGGPMSVFEKGAPGIDPEIFSLGIPVLGRMPLDPKLSALVDRGVIELMENDYLEKAADAVEAFCEKK